MINALSSVSDSSSTLYFCILFLFVDRKHMSPWWPSRSWVWWYGVGYGGNRRRSSCQSCQNKWRRQCFKKSRYKQLSTNNNTIFYTECFSNNDVVIYFCNKEIEYLVTFTRSCFVHWIVAKRTSRISTCEVHAWASVTTAADFPLESNWKAVDWLMPRLVPSVEWLWSAHQYYSLTRHSMPCVTLPMGAALRLLLNTIAGQSQLPTLTTALCQLHNLNYEMKSQEATILKYFGLEEAAGDRLNTNFWSIVHFAK